MKSIFMRLWGAPILIACATAVGLLAALLGDGGWDWLSAVTLAVPVVVCAWYGFVRPTSRCAGKPQRHSGADTLKRIK